MTTNAPPAQIGMPLEMVDTPALLVDLDAYEKNLKKMSEAVKKMNVRLRPHAKTHKCPVIALHQMTLGAVGVCCQKVGEAEAKLGQVQQKKALADIGIPFQVRQAIEEVKRHQANIKATREGYRNGRKWLVAAQSNFDLGIGEGKDVADAALAYVKLRASYFQSVYGYNLGLAKLDHATGRDVAKVKAYLPSRDSIHLQP